MAYRLRVPVYFGNIKKISSRAWHEFHVITSSHFQAQTVDPKLRISFSCAVMRKNGPNDRKQPT